MAASIWGRAASNGAIQARIKAKPQAGPRMVAEIPPATPRASLAHIGAGAKGADIVNAYFFLFAAAFAFVACCDVMSACFF